MRVTRSSGKCANSVAFNLPWWRPKEQHSMLARQALRTLPLDAIPVPPLLYAALIDDGLAGHTELFPGVPVTRTGRLRIEGPKECEPQAQALRDCFADTGYPATSVTLTRLDDVFVGMPSAVSRYHGRYIDR